MEVHPHTHTERKKWTHYFWEFFMLFLAVTLGFFVENQREHFVEHRREKQFISSLINDLKADTARLANIIAARISREHKLDSMTRLMNSNDRENHTSDIYLYAVTASRSLLTRFLPNDGTIQQLKNSGAFRLIRSPEVADSIAKYDVSIRNFLRQEELEEIVINDYRQASTKMFNALIFDAMLDVDNNVIRFVQGNPQLLPHDKNDLYVWNNRMFSMKGLNKANRRDGRLLLKQAVILLALLKKEYHLK